MPPKPGFGTNWSNGAIIEFEAWYDKEIKPLFENAVEVIKCSNGEVKVDSEDAPFLSRYSWGITGGYAVTVFTYNKKPHTVSMHRLIMGMSNCHVDHANGDTLDNRKANLRLCTRSQNMANTKRKSKTGFRGVTLNNANKLNPNWKNTFTARIKIEGERIHIGNFDTAEEAARAYDEAAKKAFGVFARLNFPEIPSKIEPIKDETAEDILLDVLESIDGLARGTDWNKGTHAREYRPRVLVSLEKAKAFLEKKK